MARKREYMVQKPNYKLALIVLALIILLVVVDFIFHLVGIHILDYADEF